MLFTSPEFLFGFLPTTLVSFLLLVKFQGARGCILWLTACSFFFYGWWNPIYVPLLLSSAALNYLVGRSIFRSSDKSKLYLAFGVTCDLVLLGYFKYANFLINTVDSLSDLNIHISSIVLPLGISFFTFTQIAFLVDCYRRKASEPDVLKYLLFVSYFPHLIAGPILHHKDMMSQFRQSKLSGGNYSQLFALGFTVFCFGLFKKVVIADGLSPLVNTSFSNAHHGIALSFWESWLAALSYSLQLYFDFSGYSEMALGLSKIFGITLPANFNSPYQARNIIDFWRRWHMTLSKFLRDYLYISLGGNRSGVARRYLNLIITMILGGLWHGAGWTFVVWGALHGVFLSVNHGWRFVSAKVSLPTTRLLLTASRAAGVGLTFICVVVAWVYFRAETIYDANQMLVSMSGARGINVPVKFMSLFESTGLTNIFLIGPIWPTTPAELEPAYIAFWVFVLSLMVLFAPSVMQTFNGWEISLDDAQFKRARYAWKPSFAWALMTAIVLIVSLVKLVSGAPTEFLYFQF